MKKLYVLPFLAALILVLCYILPTKAEAATSGYYTYTVSGGKATITDCDTSISGNITIPSTLGGYPVTSIGPSAFSGCSSLTSITIPDSVTSIGIYAFRDCSSLTSITIPDSVTSIDSSAFSGCSSLTSITIPDGVTSIGNDAFEGCSSLTTVDYNAINCSRMGSDFNPVFSGCAKLKTVFIGDKVTQIPASAFYNCSSLTSVTIGNGVTSIGGSAFFKCSSLTSITIPNGVTSIGNYAFRSCSSLPSITIPDSVTSIGNYAFAYCSSLTSIAIPDSVTSIGDSAFSGCSGLTSVTIGNGFTSIGSNTFNGCSSLTSITIPDSITSIGYQAFSYCSSLTSITIPDSVTSVGASAFYNCSSLTGITVRADNAHYASEGGALFNKGKTLLVCYPSGKAEGSYKIPDSVTSIGNYAFYNCSSLTSITIPDSVTSIGNSAFRGCSSLPSITIPDSVTSIGNYAFYNCSSLTSITIPDGVTSIGNNAFSYCSSLTSITIPDSVTSIGSSAFYNCNNFNHIAYAGTETQWSKINIVSNNTCLSNAPYLHFETRFEWVDTCTESRVYCPVCQKLIVSTKKPGDQHNWIDATCTEPKTCMVCGTTEGEPLEHNWVYSLVPPTCTEQGYTKYVCIYDDSHSYIADYTEPTGHSGMWFELVPPTCTEAGLWARICDTCGETETRPVQAHGHSYMAVTTAPTCSQSGYKTYICSYDRTHTFSVNYAEPLGHSGDLWFELLPATCTEDGIRARICDVCNETEKETIQASHDYNVIITAPNCTERGFTTYTCEVCGDSYISDYVDATGHSFSAWEQTLAPTCTTNGMNTRVCSVCTETEAASIAALGHSYESVVTAPTCTEGGYATNTCTACGDVIVADYVEAKGHSWSEWIEIKASTCTEEGIQVHFCNCGVRENAPAQKKPHSYDKEVCTDCGDVAQYDWVLTENTAVNRTLAQDLYVDLNGFDLSGTIITNGFKIYAMDSTTDGYTCGSIGYFTCVDENGNLIVPERICAEGEKQYMAICIEDRYSFHRFFVGITHMSLAPETVGLGYKTAVYGDEMVFSQLDAFTFQVQLEGYNPVYRRFSSSELASGDPITLRIRNYDVENYSEHNLYAQVSLTLNDGTVIETEQVNLTFRWLAEQVSANYTDYTSEQITQFKAMLQAFDIVKKWNIPNLI